MTAYKLFRLRKDGTLGPLFINRRQRVPVGVWLDAEDHPTKGYKHRPGWHAMDAPHAKHLTERDRVWMEVELDDVESTVMMGRTWYVAQRMRVRGPATTGGADAYRKASAA